MPDHVIQDIEGGRVDEVRQSVTVCLHARPVGGRLTTTDEAPEVRWVAPADLGSYGIHPALRRRIDHGLTPDLPPID